ncbi:hypothetical protein KPL76_14540 [Subtercola sp. PAMC28395]|uniref:hypothetical protein n=1 Tax=Subtercola sp. PAMC28395 TaxID=2846775 RepID=UPI001C0BA714|nr:hypothetical protein [Subtercola sp. PAMC28395]QWT23864.1 hypothetical protein KPL76_14540 [Subtercola sp. PAMC28395]
MTSDWLGGGLIIGLAAVLWLIYLLPTWFRRNEYLATERNVVRLQQTLRILAETSEVPDEVRVEASARSVVEQQRLLKKVTVQNTPPAVRAAAHIRKSRAVTTGILMLALVVSVLGAIQIAVNGTWIILVVGLLSAFLCLTRLGRLAKDGRALRLPGSAMDAATTASRRAGSSAGRRRLSQAGRGTSGADSSSFDHDVDDLDSAGFDEYADSAESNHDALSTDAPGSGSASDNDGSSWTPVPLPKPLYAGRAGQRHFVSSAPSLSDAERAALQAEDVLRAAAAQSEQALRAAQAGAIDFDSVGAAGRTGDADEPSGSGESAWVPSPPPAPKAPSSRFSRMGIIDDAETGALDVDQVLARRRAG